MTWPCWIWRRRRRPMPPATDRKSTRLNSSHLVISYAVFCLKKNRANGWARQGDRGAGGASPALGGAVRLGASGEGLSTVPTACKEVRVVDVSFVFFNDTATTEIYTLSLHDALPIWFSSRMLAAAYTSQSRDCNSAA